MAAARRERENGEGSAQEDLFREKERVKCHCFSSLFLNPCSVGARVVVSDYPHLFLDFSWGHEYIYIQSPVTPAGVMIYTRDREVQNTKIQKNIKIFPPREREGESY